MMIQRLDSTANTRSAIHMLISNVKSMQRDIETKIHGRKLFRASDMTAESLIDPGEAFRRAMRNRKVTPSEIAEQLNVSPSVISNWRKRGVSRRQAAVVADFLGVQPHLITAQPAPGDGLSSPAQSAPGRRIPAHALKLPDTPEDVIDIDVINGDGWRMEFHPYPNKPGYRMLHYREADGVGVQYLVSVDKSAEQIQREASRAVEKSRESIAKAAASRETYAQTGRWSRPSADLQLSDSRRELIKTLENGPDDSVDPETLSQELLDALHDLAMMREQLDHVIAERQENEELLGSYQARRILKALNDPRLSRHHLDLIEELIRAIAD